MSNSVIQLAWPSESRKGELGILVVVVALLRDEPAALLFDLIVATYTISS